MRKSRFFLEFTSSANILSMFPAYTSHLTAVPICSTLGSCLLCSLTEHLFQWNSQSSGTRRTGLHGVQVWWRQIGHKHKQLFLLHLLGTSTPIMLVFLVFVLVHLLARQILHGLHRTGESQVGAEELHDLQILCWLETLPLMDCHLIFFLDTQY